MPLLWDLLSEEQRKKLLKEFPDLIAPHIPKPDIKGLEAIDKFMRRPPRKQRRVK